MLSCQIRQAMLIAALLAVVAATTALAQNSPSPPKAATSNITGRVTVGGKGLSGVVVSLAPTEGWQRKGAARATTDGEGRYLLTGVPPGRNAILINAPAYVPPQQNPRFGDSSKSVTVYPGETIEDIDFALQRGAVITGRITDAEGEPAAFGHVSIVQIDKNGQKQPFQPNYLGWEMMQTDDRGVYRVYGLAPGRYKVSFGSSKEEGGEMYGLQSRGYFQRVFYPGTADENEAKVIELNEGDEVADVDIKLGRREATFQVNGRVIDAETNQPVPNVRVGVGMIMEQGKGFGGMMSGQQTDANGEFQISGLMPNKYQAFVDNRDEEGSEFYSELSRFEITDQNVANIEVKVRRGASISGHVVIDGATTKTTLAKLGQLILFAESAMPSDRMVPDHRLTRIGADGQFNIGGLQPGKVRITVGGGRTRRSVSLSRIERNGVDLRDGVEITAAGEQITNLRIVVAQGSGTLNVQLKVNGGTLPEAARVFINARRVSGDEGAGEHAPTYGSDVDAKGRALMEGIIAGDYELSLQVRTPQGNSTRVFQTNQTQRVTIIEGMPTDVVFTYTVPAAQETPAP